jgi:ADP-ribose pyrophosphatase YjhB (NUDIX family)
LSEHPEVAVGAVVTRAGQLLLVRRGHGPAAGEWSVPGGRVRLGEELHEAVVRETREETGLDVVVERFLGWVERIEGGTDPHHFVILDFACAPLDPDQPVIPGDDAADAAWVDLDDLDGVPLVDGLLDFLLEVGVLPSTEPLDLGLDPS